MDILDLIDLHGKDREQVFEINKEIIALFETVGDRKLTVTEMEQLDPNLAQYDSKDISFSLRLLTDKLGEIKRERVGKYTYFSKA